MLIALLFTFVLTFVVFPGTAFYTYIGFLRGVESYLSWYFIFMAFIFNCADVAGRVLGGIPALLLPDRALVGVSIGRIVFAATFLLVAFRVSIFDADWFKIINLCAFAASNGFMSTQCSIKAPLAVAPEKRARVGAFVGFATTGGILLGSLLALGMDPVLA